MSRRKTISGRSSERSSGNTSNNFYSVNTRMNTHDTETKLINQGTFGCIYYPSLPFQITKRKKSTNENDITTRKSFVSKIQKHNFHSNFEDYIGKRIQEIPSFELFFVPVIQTYKIDLATIKEKYVTDCDAIRRYIPPGSRSYDSSIHITPHEYETLNKNFVMQKMKYIKGIYLHDFLEQTVSPRHHDYPDSPPDHDISSYNGDNSDSDSDSGSGDDFSVTKLLRKDEEKLDRDGEVSYRTMSIVFDMYERIMDSIQLLIQYKIVHYDIKQNNILVEKTQKLPYIIDFGLSIDIARLLGYKWHESYEKSGLRRSTDSNIVYSSDSSKVFKDNYLWKQHFYVHAPDYYLWPIEVHLMTYLVNERETLTEESLHNICYEFVKHNRAFECMSPQFKKQIYDTSMAIFSRYIHQPREKVLNELLRYWQKWDMYAVNIMFIRILFDLLFRMKRMEHADADAATTPATGTGTDTSTDAATQSQNEERQHKFDTHYSSETKIEFNSKYKVNLKQQHDNYKIMKTIQVMLRNIHPDPEMRMTPEETKAFLVTIFYEC